MIQASDLSKDYSIHIRGQGLRGMTKTLFKSQKKVIHAVKKINLQIDEGELVGYIGPNGSGKSTTIKMLTGILEPTSGEVVVNGIVPSKDRIRNAMNIGVVFGQRTQLWWDLPVLETFELLRKLYDIPDRIYKENIQRFSELLNLNEFMEKPVRQLSLGQRMRAEFASALLHNPKVLFLDEPTIGLDVETKHRIWGFIKDMNQQRGTTMILTSHDMQDIENLSNRLIVINHGEKVFDGTLDVLKEKYDRTRRAVFRLSHMPDSLPQVNGAQIEQNADKLVIRYDRTLTGKQIVESIVQSCDVVDFELQGAHIDDIVMEVFNHHDDT